MMKSPKVSIIVPSYNHAHFLEQRLESIFNQTFQDFEVIILDDCSTDNSVSVLNRYKQHPKLSHFVINKTNSGSPFKQWQKGLKLAKGDYIWIAESDDYCELNFLEALLSCSANDGLLYAQSFDVDEKGHVLSDREYYTAQFKPKRWSASFKMTGALFIKNYLIVKNVIPNASAVIFKRDLVHDAMFSVDLLRMKMCGDWLFWIKIVSQTDICFLSKHLNYFRQHEKTSRTHDSIGKKKKRLYEEATIRTFIFEKQKLRHEALEQELLNKWFGYFKVIGIFSRDFRAIKMKQLTWIEFYLFYFKTQLITIKTKLRQ